MSFINQAIRNAPYDATDTDNPAHIILDVKPSRFLINSGAPGVSEGEHMWYYIDRDSGELWFKEVSGWVYTGYTFGGNGGGSGIDTIFNLGSGVGLFKELSVGGTSAYFKSVLSSTGKITFINNDDEVDLNVDLEKSDVGLSLVDNVKNNQFFTRAPNSDDDETLGYQTGSFWISDESSNIKMYICNSAITGAAVWVQTYPTTVPPSPTESAYLGARFDPLQSFNITLNGKTPGLVYQIDHGTNFQFYDLLNFNVEQPLGVSYFQYSGTTAKFLVNLSAWCRLSPALTSPEEIVLGLADNLPGTSVVPDSTQRTYVPVGGYGLISNSFIFQPSAGIGYSVIFSFGFPINSSLIISDLKMTINKI